MARFSVTMRTNVTSSKCKDEFLRKTSELLCKTLETDERNIILELHTNVTMMRDGSTAKAMNIDIHHNSDNMDKSTKKDVAEVIAKSMCDQLHVSEDRTLVLFFDTRHCS